VLGRMFVLLTALFSTAYKSIAFLMSLPYAKSSSNSFILECLISI
jgi:hypothetical protein